MLLSQVFHEIEKKIITSLREKSKQTPDSLEKSTNLSPDQIRRGIEWLRLKEFAIVNESKSSIFHLGTLCALLKFVLFQAVGGAPLYETLEATFPRGLMLEGLEVHA